MASGRNSRDNIEAVDIGGSSEVETRERNVYARQCLARFFVGNRTLKGTLCVLRACGSECQNDNRTHE